jgi:hypothetical protein
VTVTAIHPVIPTARRAPAPPDQTTYAGAASPVAALRLPGHVLRAVAPLLEDAGFEVLDITTRTHGPRPRLVVLELPTEEEAGRRVLAPPQGGPGRLFLAPDELGAWAVPQWPGDEIVRSPFHRLQVVAAALRVGRLPAEVVADWSGRVFDDLTPARRPVSRSACA